MNSKLSIVLRTAFVAALNAVGMICAFKLISMVFVMFSDPLLGFVVALFLFIVTGATVGSASTKSLPWIRGETKAEATEVKDPS